MSLINEALRKSTNQSPSRDPSRLAPPPPRPRRSFPLWIPFGLLALLVIFGARSLMTGGSGISQTQLEEPTLPANPTEEAKAQPPLPSKAPEPFPETSRQFLTLNGVVDDSIALINNQVIQKGEEIEGYVLKEVANKKVMLEKNGQTLELRLQ